MNKCASPLPDWLQSVSTLDGCVSPFSFPLRWFQCEVWNQAKTVCTLSTRLVLGAADWQPPFSGGNLGGNRAPCCTPWMKVGNVDESVSSVSLSFMLSNREGTDVERALRATLPTPLLKMSSFSNRERSCCACLHLYAWAWTWVPGVSSVAHHGSDSPLPCSSSPSSSSCSTTNRAVTGHFQRSQHLPASSRCVFGLSARPRRLRWCGRCRAGPALLTCGGWDWSLKPWFGVEWSEGLRGDKRIS